MDPEDTKDTNPIEKESKKGKKDSLVSVRLTLIVCLFLVAIIIVASLYRDKALKKCAEDPKKKDLSLECLHRPLDTVLKNVDGSECRCEHEFKCDNETCPFDLNNNPSCCYSPSQQCIVYYEDGSKKTGCCVSNPKVEGSFICNPNSKNCTRQCSSTTVQGSGCRHGSKQHCCEYENEDNENGWCSLTGPCSPCLHGDKPTGELTSCTNAEGSNRAEGCCYDGQCMSKSCPKRCTINKVPANEGQVCSPTNAEPGGGCCRNGTCVHLNDPTGVCPSPCRKLSGEVVGEGASCGTVDATDMGLCSKSFCEEPKATILPVEA